MRKIKIDFAKNSLRRTIWHTAPLYWFIFILGVAACLAISYTILQARALQQEQQAARNKILKARDSQIVPVKKIDIPVAQASAVNQVVLQLNLPWRELQYALDEATNEKVALLALEPEAKSRLLKITAETKNSDDMLSYIDRLKLQDFFVSVVLNKHEINEQDANRPWRFQLDLQWSEKTSKP
ncbi:hypothetical protein [Undibacterium sp.]|uniref:hypothetical protein n=1 Tax=Undibacterium sp. TaxID=1914977 RepID=UPI0025CE3D3C|nr:hypothetical protein [Undibacterium sp.]